MKSVYSFCAGLTLMSTLACGTTQAETSPLPNTLASQTDQAPALLYLTPSQVAAATPSPQTSRAKKANAASSMDGTALSELKAQQAALNQMATKVALQANELTALRQQLAQAQQGSTQREKQGADLQQLLDTQKATLSASETEKKALQQTLAANQNELTALQAQLAALKTTLEDKTQAIAALEQEQQTHKANVVAPKGEAEMRDYALGTELGAEVLDLLESRAKEENIKVDKAIALAGVEDAFSGEYRLPTDKVEEALKTLETAQIVQATQLKTQNELAGSKYVTQFRKQPRAKKTTLGYDYRIDYQGDGVIHPDDLVAIVVKESLVDGTVIKDMEAAGTSVSQPLSAYPPLFKSALGQLQNHGSMTLVVPPKLAYGDKGLPPSIPPGATMVYTVRILDVVPAPSAPAADKK